MATKTAGNVEFDANDPQQVRELIDAQRALLEEVSKSRTPGYNQPVRMMQRMASEQRHLMPEVPFRSFGHMLVELAQRGSGQAFRDGDLGRKYAKAFDAWGQTPHGREVFKTLPTGMNETVGADGGVLVAPQFVNQLLMRTYQNDLLSRTTMLPMTVGNKVSIPAVNESSRARGSRFGGVVSYWRGEGETIDLSKVGLRTVDLTLDSLMVLMKATEELLQDAPLFTTYADMVISQELAFRIGEAVVRGPGGKLPQGLMNSPSKLAISKEAGQAAATVTAKNITNMLARLHLSCWGNATWLYDQSLIAALPHMTIGTAGAQMPVYLPANGLAGKPQETILGKEAFPTEFNYALGTEGDLILTDLATHLSASKGGIQSASSMHVYFLTNEQAFRFVYRLDLRNWWLSALTPFSGGATQSNIVTIETRS